MSLSPIADAVMGGLGAVLKPITNVVEQWQTRVTARTTANITLTQAITDAKIKRLQTSEEGDIAWENTALTTAGWKAGYMTIVLSIPMILCFVPGLDTYIDHGFQVLQNTPVWYQAGIGSMIAATFGVKHLTDFMALKKGA